MAEYSTLYILADDGETPIACADVQQFGAWFKKTDRKVKSTEVGPALVSTVFLGMDHGFGGDGPPVLWETMIFGGPRDGDCERVSSRADALAVHDRVVAELKGEV